MMMNLLWKLRFFLFVFRVLFSETLLINDIRKLVRFLLLLFFAGGWISSRSRSGSIATSVCSGYIVLIIYIHIYIHT